MPKPILPEGSPVIITGIGASKRMFKFLKSDPLKKAKKYVEKALIELEDGLRNAFESLGDITLFLRQKTIDPNPEETSGPDIESLASDA